MLQMKGINVNWHRSSSEGQLHTDAAAERQKLRQDNKYWINI